MVWIPGIDEIPMSLSTINEDKLSAITVERVGEATAALHLKESGDLIGIRGPYGKGFKLFKGSVMVVGGGTGVTSLVPLAEKLKVLGSKITFIFGSRTKSNLIFLDKINKILVGAQHQIIVTTDDGSYGVKGSVTSPVKNFLKKEIFDIVYTCGPGPMMSAVFELAEQSNIPVQASLERVMRCSVGLCGSCVVDKFRVCKDGPVFTSEQLRNMKTEFNRNNRSFIGDKVNV